MIGNLIAAELFKLRTTRTFFGVCAGILALIALIVALSASLDSYDPGDEPLKDLVDVATFVWPFALVIGILGTSTEFRHGTITPTLLAVPDRGRLVAAKLIAHVAAGLLLGVVVFLFAAGLGAAILSIRDIEGGLTTSELFDKTLGGALAAALYAGIGVGLGALIANQVGAIVGALAWVFLLEGLISSIPGMDFLSTYGLNGLSAAMSSATDIGFDTSDLIDAVPAGLLLALYAVVFAAAGALVMHRRDVDSK